jgi:ubiquinone/menaquinone biosynthesis C-methylase UbiE
MTSKVGRQSIFDRDAERYDSWFERNLFAYQSELAALRQLFPNPRRSVEVGVGTGRFSAALGIGVGLEPSEAMGALARMRGVEVRVGRAEHMPFADRSFDLVLMVTTICFLDDVAVALREAYRVLDFGGHIMIGMLDFHSAVGMMYAQRVADSDFFRGANQLSVDEVVSQLAQAGFSSFEMRQSVFQEPHAMAQVDSVREGYGEGLFVVIRAMKAVQLASGT